MTEVDQLKSEIERLRAELDQIKMILSKPNLVQLNMLSGTIAWTEETLYAVLGVTPNELK